VRLHVTWDEFYSMSKGSSHLHVNWDKRPELLAGIFGEDQTRRILAHLAGSLCEVVPHPAGKLPAERVER
jgi:hypothetical protein